VALFMGESGRGKSTWSAVLRRHGHHLLSDDCVLVRDGGRLVRAVPTYPSLRLLPDMVAQLGLNGSARARLAGYSSKRRLAVMPPEMPWRGLEVGAIYVLEGPASERVSPRVEELSPARSCLELTRSTFRLDPTDVDQTKQLLARTASVAERVPTFSLHYPRKVAALPDFARRVAEHFRTRVPDSKRRGFGTRTGKPRLRPASDRADR
jgi:hypothetical protein